jgi:hypothetical protein
MKGKIGATHLQANRRTVGTTIHTSIVILNDVSQFASQTRTNPQPQDASKTHRTVPGNQ